MLLHKFVKGSFTNSAEFDFDLFREMVRRAVRHLDNVTELNFGRHPLAEQEIGSKLGRRIGLGITGLADMLTALNLRYDSQEALDIVTRVMETKMIEEYKASIQLSKERGPFPLFDAQKHYEQGFCSRLPEEIRQLGQMHGQRNSGISTVAPNGSLSIIAQCSGGIEPIFALNYTRYVELGKVRKAFMIYHPGVCRFHHVAKQDALPDLWVSAHQIDYGYRIKMQGLVQKFVDASISSTVNAPRDVSAETVGQIYIDAWKEGLKGITVYREGSREGVLVTDAYAQAIHDAGLMDTVVQCVRAEGGDKFYIMTSYKDCDIKQPYQVFVLNYKQADRDSFVKISNALIKMLKSKGVPDKRINKYIERSKDSLAKLTRFLSLSMKTNNLEAAVEVLNEHAFAGTLASRLYDIFHRSLTISKAVCKNCQSSNIRMGEGCIRCLDCNWEGCGG
jgi:ribonucleoside-diphosphate reductase alpha chain